MDKGLSEVSDEWVRPLPYRRVNQTGLEGINGLSHPEYRILCFTAEESTRRAGHHRAGVLVGESVVNNSTWIEALISACIMSMTFSLTGK